MKVVRTGVFETNSSSCHSICICSKEEYESEDSFLFEWEDNKIFNKESFKKYLIDSYSKIPEYKDKYSDLDSQFDKVWEAYKQFDYDLETYKEEVYWEDSSSDYYSSSYKDEIPEILNDLKEHNSDFDEVLKKKDLFSKYFALPDNYKELCSYFYENIYTIEEWLENKSYYFETYEDYYTTKSGDKVVAFGYYGHD